MPLLRLLAFIACYRMKPTFYISAHFQVFMERVAVDCVWNVMANGQEQDFVFRRNGRIHLNRRGRHFTRLLAAEVCASAIVMLDKPCPEVVWRVLVAHSIRQFPLHFPSRASPCAISFQLDSTYLLPIYNRSAQPCVPQSRSESGTFETRSNTACHSNPTSQAAALLTAPICNSFTASSCISEGCGGGTGDPKCVGC